MDLFYLPELDRNATDLLFPREESKHINKVLRKRQGEKVRATNGKGLEVIIQLSVLENNQVRGIIIETIAHQPLPYQLHIAISPTKNIGRFEWFLEKATEIGIHQITPIVCFHSERKVIKPERLEKIITAALKQSQQFYRPRLNPLTHFNNFIEQNPDGLIAHCREGDKASLFSAANPMGQHTILIGPEGDFSEPEITQALNNNFKAINLGKQRLRTETAAIVACHTIALKAQ